MEYIYKDVVFFATREWCVSVTDSSYRDMDSRSKLELIIKKKNLAIDECQKNLDAVLAAMCLDVSQNIGDYVKDGLTTVSYRKDTGNRSVPARGAGMKISYYKIYQVEFWKSKAEHGKTPAKSWSLSVGLPTDREKKPESERDIAEDTLKDVEGFLRSFYKVADGPLEKGSVLPDPVQVVQAGVVLLNTPDSESQEEATMGGKAAVNGKDHYASFFREYNQEVHVEENEQEVKMGPITGRTTYTNPRNPNNMDLVTCSKLGASYQKNQKGKDYEDDKTIRVCNEICDLNCRGVMVRHDGKYVFIKRVVGFKKTEEVGAMGVESMRIVDETTQGILSDKFVQEVSLPRYRNCRDARSMGWSSVASICVHRTKKYFQKLGFDTAGIKNSELYPIKLHVIRPSDTILYARLHATWDISQKDGSRDVRTISTFYVLCTFLIRNIRPPGGGSWKTMDHQSEKVKDVRISLRPMYKMLAKFHSDSVKPSSVKTHLSESRSNKPSSVEASIIKTHLDESRSNKPSSNKPSSVQTPSQRPKKSDLPFSVAAGIGYDKTLEAVRLHLSKSQVPVKMKKTLESHASTAARCAGMMGMLN